jgi:tetratricopeptide (TPR) repeat protein
MVVDPRHDHSFRIPRPDLTVEIGTPNACNQCHDDKDAVWADSQVKQWYGEVPVGYQQFAKALDAGRNGSVNAGKLLADQVNKIETPDIARASAISQLSRYLDQLTFEVIQRGLKDEDAMVRMASVASLEGLQPSLLVKLVFPLLDDPVVSVRIEAARVLAPIPLGQLQGEQLSSYRNASNEYIESQLANAERPEAQLNLGNYYAAIGDSEKAIASYKKAIALENIFIPAYINLSDLYRAQQKEVEAEKILKQAINTVPASADANYALGLSLVRNTQSKKAVDYLKKAAVLDMENSRYAYVYAVALNSTGQQQQAISAMQDAHKRFPEDRDILSALVAFHRDAGNDFASQTYMNKLQKLR